MQSLSEQVASLTTSLQSSDSVKFSLATEVETLRKHLEDERAKIVESASSSEAMSSISAELDKANGRIVDLDQDLQGEKVKQGEQEKEHEDLLVLLEELSQKRRRDRTRLKDAGLSVSDAEDEEEGNEEEE